MEHLTLKNINQLGFYMYKIDQPSQFEELIDRFGLDKLLETKNNGIISNILLHYIKMKDDLKINLLIDTVSLLNGFELMKRDYLNLIKYYYMNQMTKALDIFDNKICCLTNPNTQSMFLPKDIDCALENNWIEIIKRLDGLFIETTRDCTNQYIPGVLNLKKYQPTQKIIMSISNVINTTIKSHQQLETFWSTIVKVDTIIDAGNVIHSRRGSISTSSLGDLLNIAQQSPNPLIVIHQRHTKTIKHLETTLKNLKLNYWLTPNATNDDLFIMWFFLKTNMGATIISNDNFRDHIFNFETKNKKNNLDLNWSQFKNIIWQQTLKYNIHINKINKPPTYSKCIQYDDNYIYVPHKSGNFVRIPQM
jgi:hypothetical protein